MLWLLFNACATAALGAAAASTPRDSEYPVTIEWKTDRYGYDGDFMYGNVQVNYWHEPKRVEAELDEQLSEIRQAILAEYQRLRPDGE